MRRKTVDNKMAILILIFLGGGYLFIGFLIFSDYGISSDEIIQRQHSLIAYKYINEKVFHREIIELEELPDLEEYEHKYYGVAVQMPLVMVEDLYGFQLTTRQVYLIRHLYNFLICFLGNICFFCFLKKIFLNHWFALFGTVLIVLYPRFFATEFYDIKNMIFVALNMFTLVMLVNVVEDYNWGNVFAFAFSSALATNQRIMGILFPAVLVGYYILADVTDIYRKKAYRNRVRVWLFEHFVEKVKKYFCILGLYFFLWTLITPAAWSNPIKTFYATFRRFSNYYLWDGTMVFCGQIITSQERPWYYLFVWFGISIPVIYLILFIVGHIYALNCFLKSENKWDDLLGKYKWLTCSLVLFWGTVSVIIISNANIYIEWRHMYFVFVPFCSIVVYGFSYLLQIINRKICCCIMAICILLQISWIIQNHPYQYMYFNVIGQHFASKFDRDTWCVASYDMIKWILEHNSGQVTVKGRSVDYNMLAETEKSKIIITDANPAYIIENYRNVIGNSVEHAGYEEVYTIWIGKNKIGSVFQKD